MLASLLFLLLCFSAFPASLLFCFSAFLLFCFSAFPVSSLLCFSAFLIFWFACFSAFLLLCFSCFSLFCFSALLCFLLFQRLCLSCLSVSVPFCSYFCMPSLLIKTKMISPPFTKRINSLPSIYPPHAITRHHCFCMFLSSFFEAGRAIARQLHEVLKAYLNLFNLGLSQAQDPGRCENSIRQYDNSLNSIA